MFSETTLFSVECNIKLRDFNPKSDKNIQAMVKEYDYHIN